MNKLKYFILCRILHTLNCTVITLYLNYGILIWGSTSKWYLDKIMDLQKWTINLLLIIITEITPNHYLPKNNLLSNNDMKTLVLGGVYV